LNDYYRFDKAGKYTVHLITKRLRQKKSGGQNFEYQPLTELSTNNVSFEIRAMSEADEEAEAKRLGAAIESTSDFWEKVRLAEELANLPGDAAIPEKIARYQWATKQNAGNFVGALYKGLFVTRNRAWVIRDLEEILSDVSKAVDFQMVGILSSLRAKQIIAASGKPYVRPNYYLPLPADDPYSKANEYYLKFVIDSLPKRVGKNLIDTAFGLFRQEPRQLSSDLMAKVRGILIKNFDTLDIFDREQLLSANWDKIRDASLIPSIERMLKDNSYPPYGRMNVHGTALKRLYELDREKARTFMAMEIANPDSILSDEVIEEFDGKVMPEVDQPLLEQVTKLTRSDSNNDSAMLRWKFELVAKFASEAIYEPLMEIYRMKAPKWQWNSRAILLGYFARYRAPETLRLVEEELAKIEPEWRGSFLHDFTKMNYPPDVAEFVEKRLASDDPEIAGVGAYLISQHGSPADRSKIEARLKEWKSLWEKKYSELDSAPQNSDNARQAHLQVELIMALILGKSWKLTDDDKKELRAHCLTQVCKQAFHW
jgi:hypothetical protein